MPGNRWIRACGATGNMEKGRTSTVCQPLPGPRSRSARSSLGRTVSFGSQGCAEHLKGGRAATNWPSPTGTMCYWEGSTSGSQQ